MALSKLEQAAMDKLPEIVAATVTPGTVGYVFAVPFDIQYLIDNGYVEQNPELSQKNADEEIELATRATTAGIEYVAQATGVVSQNKAEQPKPKGNNKMSFEIENVPVVAGKRGGGSRVSQYPVDALEVGQSFFVPATEKHPEPEKSLASMLSGAMKKYDVADIDEATGVQKTKVITVPKTKEKRTIPATKHTRKFTLVAAEKDGVKGARIGRTA